MSSENVCEKGRGLLEVAWQQQILHAPPLFRQVHVVKRPKEAAVCKLKRTVLIQYSNENPPFLRQVHVGKLPKEASVCKL
jgi:hypothetical protein